MNNSSQNSDTNFSPITPVIGTSLKVLKIKTYPYGAIYYTTPFTKTVILFPSDNIRNSDHVYSMIPIQKNTNFVNISFAVTNPQIYKIALKDPGGHTVLNRILKVGDEIGTIYQILDI